MAAKKNQTALIAVIAIALIAVAGYFFMSDNDASEMPEAPSVAQTQAEADQQSAENDEDMAPEADVETAAGNPAQKITPDTPSAMENPDFKVEEGNPVVAKVDGKDITRVDVYRFIQTMPTNVQQMPAVQIYPIAMEQVINARLVQNMADEADIEETPEFQKEMDMAKQQIKRNLYLQNQVNDKITESRLKKIYNDFIKKVPDVEERRARHILVETEDKAKAVIEKIEQGKESFEELATSLSIGPTAPKGGDLGYFAESEMVPEFAEKAFSMKKGEVSEPVQTQFGWHVIKLVDIRDRPKPTYDQLKPNLEVEARREILDDLLQKWRKSADIVQYDINGKPLKDGANSLGIVPQQSNNTTQPADNAQQGG